MIPGLWTKIKFYAYIGAGLILALLAGWIKMLKYQRDAARKDATVAERNVKEVKEIVETERDIHQAVRAAEQEAIHVEKENQERKESGVPPVGPFGDRRLRDLR